MEQLMVASFALLRHRIQCDQIGLFLKVLGDKFSYKSSRKIWWLLASCEKIKTSGKILLVNFWKNWATLDSVIWSHCIANLEYIHLWKAAIKVQTINSFVSKWWTDRFKALHQRPPLGNFHQSIQGSNPTGKKDFSIKKRYQREQKMVAHKKMNPHRTVASDTRGPGFESILISSVWTFSCC